MVVTDKLDPNLNSFYPNTNNVTKESVQTNFNKNFYQGVKSEMSRIEKGEPLKKSNEVPGSPKLSASNLTPSTIKPKESPSLLTEIGNTISDLLSPGGNVSQ